jgi:diguanylate cyclase
VSHRILLIENDAVVAEFIRHMLTQSDDDVFQVEWVRSCAEGLNRTEGIEAILLDLELPDSAGIDTFDRFFGAAPRIPILVLMDPQEEETAKLAVQCGAQDYLFKDRLDGYLLAKTLRSMIDRMAYAGAQFEEKAEHDRLTDLPNRVLLSDRLSEAITLSSRYHRRLAVLCLDLDRFKHLNDSLGHAVGDRLLQSVTRRLFTCVRSSDTVARPEGDEFVVLLWELRRPEDAALTAAKILEALRKPHQINERELHITGSIGIAIYPDDGTEADALMKKADLAMYHAKQVGRDNYQFFKPEMSARAIERQSLQEGLYHAIERQQLSLHYQPKLDLVTREIIGAEALVRWRHPLHGLIPTAQFISIAEDCGLIVPLGRWVLREACRQMHSWQLAGLAPRCIAINVSVVELRAPDFVAGVRAILAETGLESRFLELELPEAPLIEDMPIPGRTRSVAEVLRELKNVGALLALDDFGTGYSSLSHLKHLPIDTLKIDPSFVRDLTRNNGGVGIVIGLIGMGNCLNMRVVAEGVETREQLEILAKHGCSEGQGYYFSRPVPAEEFGRMLERDAAGTHLPDQIAFEELLAPSAANHRLIGGALRQSSREQG